jgi:hypothetical protein
METAKFGHEFYKTYLCHFLCHFQGFLERFMLKHEKCILVNRYKDFLAVKASRSEEEKCAKIES